MAIAKGNQSTDGVVRTLYTGVGAVKVLAINPSKAELEKFYDRTIDNDPVYVSEAEVEGKKILSARLSFIVEVVGEKNNGIEFITSHNFFIQKTYRKGSQSGKFQVIDKFGRTAWATPDKDFKVVDGKFEVIQIPEYTNGPANIDIDYRPCFIGEEELTTFLKNYLNIPNIQSYVNGEWVKNTKVDENDCICRLDFIDNYFKGDFKELKEYISYQPENIVKIGFGIRTTDDNKQYQTTYPQWSAKNSVTDYSKFAAEIANRKSNGGLATTEFEFTDLHEYVVNPSNPSANNGESFAAQMSAEKAPWED